MQCHCRDRSTEIGDASRLRLGRGYKFANGLSRALMFLWAGAYLQACSPITNLRRSQAESILHEVSTMERANALAIRRYPAAVGCTCPEQQSPDKGSVLLPIQIPDHSCIGVKNTSMPSALKSATIPGASALNVSTQVAWLGKPRIEARYTFAWGACERQEEWMV